MSILVLASGQTSHLTWGLRLPLCEMAKQYSFLGSKHTPGEKTSANVYNSITDVAAETANRAKPEGVPDPPWGLFLRCPPPVLHPNWAGWPPASGQAPGLFPGGEFPLALWGSPRRMHQTAAGNEEHIFKSEGEAMSWCQISGLDPGLRDRGPFPLTDSRCSSRCGYGNKINDG